MVGASQRRSAVRHLERRYSVSERRSCQVTGTHRSTHRYQSVRPSQEALRRKIRELAQSRIRWFDDLTDERRKLQAWQREYNESRPHRSLKELSPQQFKALWVQRTSEIH